MADEWERWRERRRQGEVGGRECEWWREGGEDEAWKEEERVKHCGEGEIKGTRGEEGVRRGERGRERRWREIKRARAGERWTERVWERRREKDVKEEKEKENGGEIQE